MKRNRHLFPKHTYDSDRFLAPPRRHGPVVALFVGAASLVGSFLRDYLKKGAIITFVAVNLIALAQMIFGD